MLVATAQQATALRALDMEVKNLREEIARQETKLDELIAGGRPGARELDIQILRLCKDLKKAERKLDKKRKRHEVSPALASVAKNAQALNDRAAAQRRFWGYDRKDMY